MKTEFSIMLLIGIFAVSAIMITYNSHGAKEKEGRMYASTNCRSGKNPQSNISHAKAWGLLGVAFKNGGYIEKDYARGSGTIYVYCGGNSNTYNVDVSCRAYKNWLGKLRVKYFPEEREETCAAPADVEANVNGTATKGGHSANSHCSE
ncbi:MAG: hypothetical protein OXI43_13975 [Candidatus Poribacteria bacterium]|nr:hypothetical protein [Candidatus Poribacteria bacterium]